MTTWQLLTRAWAFEPSIVAGCAGLLAAYAALARPARPPRAALYGAGVAALLLALVSPVDTLGDRYLFSAHMLQHLLLVLVVPPLLILGLPPATVGRLLARAPARRAERILAHPLVAWLLGLATLWIWHAPPLYDAALADEGVHILQHLSFLVTSTIFWWPVLAPEIGPTLTHNRETSVAAGDWERRLFAGQTLPAGDWERRRLAGPVSPVDGSQVAVTVATMTGRRAAGAPSDDARVAARRLPPLGAIVYLTAALVASSVLGIIITFAPTGLYPAYLHPIDRLGALGLLRDGWGLTPAADQQLGGVLMWIMGGPIYLAAVLAVLVRWYTAPEEDDAGAMGGTGVDAGAFASVPGN